MAVIKYPLRAPTYSAWRDFEEPFNRLARLVDDLPTRGDGEAIWSPAVSVTESADELVLTAELPGMSDENVHVELENNVLSISGEKMEVRTEGEDNRHYHLWERRFGTFRRSFTLPSRVSAEDVNATFDNGILTVRLPKVPEAKGRKIEISKN